MKFMICGHLHYTAGGMKKNPFVIALAEIMHKNQMCRGFAELLHVRRLHDYMVEA